MSAASEGSAAADLTRRPEFEGVDAASGRAPEIGGPALRLHAAHREGFDAAPARDLHRFDRRGPSLRLVSGEPASPAMGVDLAQRVRTMLETSVGRDRLQRILAESRLSIDGKDLLISVESRAAGGLIERRLGAEIRRLLEEIGDGSSLRIVVAESERGDPSPAPARFEVEPAVAHPARAAAAAPATASLVRSGRIYRLEDFVIGESNRLAYNAAHQMAEGAVAGGACLFIHGPCGVGKTHLLQGLAQHFRETHPGAVVRIVSGETFLNEFVNAVRHGGGSAMTGHTRSTANGGVGGGIERFRRQYRRCDLLCIDDVHLLASKQATQQELLHTFDQIAQSGARIVLACDRHPRNMKAANAAAAAAGAFSPALVSRFLSGMVAEIQPPDALVRERALRMFAQRRGLMVEEAAVRELVERTAPRSGQLAPSVRDLEGLLTRVEAIQRVDVGQASDSCGPLRIGVLAVRRALGAGETEASGAAVRRPLRPEQIISAACLALGVERAELGASTRHRRVVLARAVITHACRELTTMSYPEIARALGRPSHSTVITAHKRLAEQMASGEIWGIGPGGEGVTVSSLVREVIAGLTK